MRIPLCLCCLLLAMMLGMAQAFAQSRVALVIGNGAYQNVPALRNPGNDASDVAASLGRLGFRIYRVDDGTFDDMRHALRDFAQAAQGSEIAVVYYSGHGMEIAGENWLIPTDAQLKTELTADQEAVALKSVMPIVGAASKLGLIILDACRNNPFAPRMQRGLRTRAVERGLTAVEPAGSVLVAFAARDGTTADDGAGRNSPFTTALLGNIEKPGLEINFLFRNVREAVLLSTNRHQEPVVYGSLPSAEIYFKPRNAAEGPAMAPPPSPVPAGPLVGALPVMPPQPPPGPPAMPSPGPPTDAPAWSRLQTCNAAWSAMKAKGTVGDGQYADFRKECLAGQPVFPAAVSPKYSGEDAAKARLHTCIDQYQANKVTGGNGVLIWIEKDGGYYNACTRRLRG